MLAKVKALPLDDSEILKDWMRRNTAIVHEVLVELEPELLALMVHDPNRIGFYLIKQLKAAKQEQEALENLPEEIDEEALDRRDRMRDVQQQIAEGW